MSEVRLAYRALRPDEARQAITTNEDDHQAALDRIQTYIAEQGFPEGTEARAFVRFDNAFSVTGFSEQYGNPWKGDVPDGGRVDVKTGWLMPAKRTPEGKEWAKALYALGWAPGPVCGVGGVVFGKIGDQSYTCAATFHLFGDGVFATYPVDRLDERPGVEGVPETHPEWWEQVPLSTFHLARETHEAEVSRVS